METVEILHGGVKDVKWVCARAHLFVLYHRGETPPPPPTLNSNRLPPEQRRRRKSISSRRRVSKAYEVLR